MYMSEEVLDRFESIKNSLIYYGTSGECPTSDDTCPEYKFCSSFVPDLRNRCPCDSGVTTAQLIRIVTMILRQNGRR